MSSAEEKLEQVTLALSDDELAQLGRAVSGGDLSPELTAKLQLAAEGFNAEERAEVRAIGGGEVEGFMIDQHRKPERPDDIPTPGGGGSNLTGRGQIFVDNVKTVAGIFSGLF